jgi:transposase-like protein
MATRRKTTPPPAPPNISALARKHGVSRETLRKLRENGVDLADEKAVSHALAISKAGQSPPPPVDGGETYTEARRRREIANANRAETLADRERGRFVEVAEAEAVINLLDHCVCLVWKGVGRELPNHLDGLTASQMVAAINSFVDKILIPRFADQLQSGLKRLKEAQNSSP